MALDRASETADEAPSRNELPVAMRGAIPAISIAFHAYSSCPRERRVAIDGDVAGEADRDRIIRVYTTDPQATVVNGKVVHVGGVPDRKKIESWL